MPLHQILYKQKTTLDRSSEVWTHFMLLVEGTAVKPLFEEGWKNLKIDLLLYVSPSGTTDSCICTTENTYSPCENVTSITSTANTYPSEPCDCSSVTTESSPGILPEITAWVNFCNLFIFCHWLMHAYVYVLLPREVMSWTIFVWKNLWTYVVEWCMSSWVKDFISSQMYLLFKPVNQVWIQSWCVTFMLISTIHNFSICIRYFVHSISGSCWKPK